MLTRVINQMALIFISICIFDKTDLVVWSEKVHLKYSLWSQTSKYIVVNILVACSKAVLNLVKNFWVQFNSSGENNSHLKPSLLCVAYRSRITEGKIIKRVPYKTQPKDRASINIRSCSPAAMDTFNIFRFVQYKFTSLLQLQVERQLCNLRIKVKV